MHTHTHTHTHTQSQRTHPHTHTRTHTHTNTHTHTHMHTRTHAHTYTNTHTYTHIHTHTHVHGYWEHALVQIDLNKWKLKWILSLPQTSRANPVQCCSTHQKKNMHSYESKTHCMHMWQIDYTHILYSQRTHIYKTHWRIDFEYTPINTLFYVYTAHTINR